MKRSKPTRAEQGSGAWPRISIVTPTLNQADYLEQTLHSIHSQGYPNLEHIVVDGGSTDNTVALLRDWDQCLHWWVSEPDTGQAQALNKGFAHATGEVLAYLNSDDLYLPGALHRVARVFKEDNSVDMVHGICQVVDANGALIRMHTASIQHFSQIVDLWRVWWGNRQFIQPEVFWRRRVMPGPFNESLYFVLDYEFWLRMLRNGARVATVPVSLACFRITPTQKTCDRSGVSDELLNVVAEVLWDPTAPVAQRWRLQGDWLYQSVFLPMVADTEERQWSRLRRWVAVLWLVLQHPKLAFSRSLYQRLQVVWW